MNTGNFQSGGTAVVAVTEKGAELGRHLKTLFPGSRLYLPEKFAAAAKDEHSYQPPVKAVVGEVFHRYRQLVLIMAVGIAVRSIASEVTDKRADPGVVVVDEGGSYAVSLLSGHAGGANALAERIAAFLGARPVITTASEVGDTISADLLGREFGWEREEEENLTGVSAALVNGERVGLYRDAGEKNWWPETKPLPENVTVFDSLDALAGADCAAALVITDRTISEEKRARLPRRTVVYRPKSLVAGIGCNRGTGADVIEAAVRDVFSRHGLSTGSIRSVATIDLKRDEEGLLRFARGYGLPVEYYDRESLSAADFPSPASEVARKYAGTPAVCESAAILSSGAGLIVPKASFRGAVTVAVARLPFDRAERGGGRLFLTGLGPGGPEQMTFRAREAICRSEVVVGYRVYIRLIEPFLRGKEIIATGMGAEVARVKTAIDLAQKGRVVSIVCSGDAGIYGMAGLAGEILRERGEELEMEVVPGVPAVAAAAALLGAPLMGDFAAISLSDYLVTWEKIGQRLELAAEGDFVIALYNPRSKKRPHQLAAAREIIRRHRASSTPAGIVTGAYREGQSVVITDLEHLLDHEVDMNTIIIIGNSATFTFDGRMVTPRGYKTKYDLKGGAEPPDGEG